MKNGIHSFRDSATALVIGSSGGIGRSLVLSLINNKSIATVYTGSRTSLGQHPKAANHLHVDLENEESIKKSAEIIQSSVECLDIVLLATGILWRGSDLLPEKNLQSLNLNCLEEVFKVNTFGPAIVMKYFLPMLNKNQKSVFAVISAKVGSIQDNRLGGWYGYRSSKTALNMMIKTASIELRRKNALAICVALHPGTVDTALSSPFRNSVSSSVLVSPDTAAGNLLRVIDKLSVDDTGGFFSWNGERIPY